MTKDNDDVKPDSWDLALEATAMNRDGFESFTSPKQSNRWSGSFTGKDFQCVVQIWALMLGTFYASRGGCQVGTNRCLSYGARSQSLPTSYMMTIFHSWVTGPNG
ncbi:hypothetical protein K470DRAFT_257453 [Piedraia hortae CBS 480.64]|uniref:Uncharacterized protein n=1 Tax=Piedraia hortae CBS 480.64 TaxID=1314780 RepID=A0A6A7C067_9PEZI|nr:hypothetical protein K470DRAFT_257453 [Piedraia hortae CBS 480.64]